MRRLILATLAVAVVLALPAEVAAHEGHDHKLMGTLTSIDAKQLVMKTTEGADKTVLIVEKTTFHRGKGKGTATELKAGMRVVVNIGPGKEPLTAKDIQYAAAATEK